MMDKNQHGVDSSRLFGSGVLVLLVLSLLIHGVSLFVIQKVFLDKDSGLEKLKLKRSLVLLESSSEEKAIHSKKPGINPYQKIRNMKAGNISGKGQQTNFQTNTFVSLTNAQTTVQNKFTNSSITSTNAQLSNALAMNPVTNDIGQTNSVSNVSEPYYFRLGEKISYNVEVEVKEIPAIKGVVGTVDVEVLELTNIRGRECFHCRSTVRSLDAIINLYELKDVFDTWFDSRTLKTYQIEKQVKEGGWMDSITNYLYSDEDYGIVFSKTSPEKGGRYELRRNSFDIITLLYFLRITDKTALLNLNWIADFGQRKELAIQFNKGEKVSLDLTGKDTQVDTVVASEKDTGIKIYLAEGHDYLPVRAEIPAFKIVGYTFNLIATFRHYDPGKNWLENGAGPVVN